MDILTLLSEDVWI
jgi:hypothetical protein